ncbi:MAG: hypothetical protein JXL97_13685 [Bacteroidales bacterium]|nr:hypothetical protein [Bacteroidales bacterium]
MNKILIFSGLIFILIIGCTNHKAWETAQEQNTIEGYLMYIEQNPESEFIEIANLKIDSMLTIKDENDWKKAQELNTSDAYKNYIVENNLGKYVEQAQEKFSALKGLETWLEVEVQNSKEACEEYINEFPESSYVPDAKMKIFLLSLNKNQEQFQAIADFFLSILHNGHNYDNYFSYFISDTCFMNDKYVAQPFNKKTAEEYGHWEVINNAKYLLDLLTICNNGYYEDLYFQGDCTANFDKDNNITFYFDLSTMGYMYNFEFEWQKLNGKYVIIKTNISLPNYM